MRGPPRGHADHALGGGRPVLNIGRMAPGGEEYYLATVADGVEDYYLGRGEAPGRWLGAGAARLELAGEVTAEQLRAVLAGRSPSCDERLGRRPNRRVPGFDLTFRAPKSVSLLWALGDEAAAAQVHQAHDAAVAAALGYLERHAARSRRGRNGVEQVAVHGLVAAAFRHRTSRAGDPLLHTHVLVANLAQALDDGVWRTLDSRRLYAHSKTAGYLYQAHLRDELTRRLDVTWEPIRNGTTDLSGIPREMIEAFSQRRAQIVALLEQRGETSARAAQVATLETRPAKDQTDPLTLHDRWQDRARQFGFDPAIVRTAIGQSRHGPDSAEFGEVAVGLLGEDGLTAQASTFSRRDVLQAWCQRLQDGASVAEVEALTDALLDPEATSQIVALDAPRSPVRTLTGNQVIRRSDGRVVTATAGEGRYTTAELLALEQRLVDQASARRTAGVAQVPKTLIESTLRARPTVSAEQAAMVRRLCTSGAGVEVVVGKAGAGKTYALDAAREAWQATGAKVVGAALAARAALQLEAGAGITSMTIDRLLVDLANPHSGGLTAGTVLVIDEAGMVGTRKLGRLLDAADAAGAKIVLVGDPHQLPEIDAGGLLRGLTNRLPTVQLTDNRRQVEVWERGALDQLRNGEPTAAVAAYQQHGRITVADTAEAAREQLVGDWWQSRQDHGIDAIMIAARRADVADLNARARQRMAAAGALTGPVLEAADRIFQAGDRILCLRNRWRPQVVNGTRGTVVAVDTDHRRLTFERDDDGQLITLPAGYLDAGHVDHGYALTAHKAQGSTCQATFVLGSDAIYREWGYVALSRGRHANHLYLTGTPDHNGDCHHPRQPQRCDATRRLAVDLHRSRAQHLALDHTGGHLADVPDHQLAAERARLPVHTSPADPAQRRRQRLEQRRQQLAAQRAAAQTQLDEISTARRRPRWKRRRHTADPHQQRLTAAVALYDQQLRELDRDLARLTAARDDRGSPDHTAALAAVDAEISTRAHRRTQTHAAATPAYLAAVIGHRSHHPADQAAWDQAAAAVETYRLTYDVHDPTRPLGEHPTDPTRRRAYDHAAAQLTLARRQLLDQPHHRNLGQQPSARGLA